MAIKYYTGNRFRSVRKEVTRNDPQNESIVDKCNSLVPLSELALGEFVEKSYYEIRFYYDVRRSNI